MDTRIDGTITEPEANETLQAAYNRLFVPIAQTEEADGHSLAQPYPTRYVQSITTDYTEPEKPRP